MNWKSSNNYPSLIEKKKKKEFFKIREVECQKKMAGE